MKIKIKLFGARCQWCQLDRIEDGLKSLGCEISDNPEVVYCNNFDYSEAIQCAKQHNAFLILNVLDIPVHTWTQRDLAIFDRQLGVANVITCISKTVQEQIKYFCKRNTSIIYNPAKDIVWNGSPYKDQNLILYAGRARDKNKRFDLIKEALKDREQDIRVVGPEDPQFGAYCGVVTDETLNNYFNSSKIVLLPSQFEGLGLTAIEAIFAKAVPILCNDNPTALELYPRSLLCDPTPEALRAKIEDVERNYHRYQFILEDIRPWFLKTFNKIQIAQNILDLCKKN